MGWIALIGPDQAVKNKTLRIYAERDCTHFITLPASLG